GLKARLLGDLPDRPALGRLTELEPAARQGPATFAEVAGCHAAQEEPAVAPDHPVGREPGDGRRLALAGPPRRRQPAPNVRIVCRGHAAVRQTREPRPPGPGR